MPLHPEYEINLFGRNEKTERKEMYGKNKGYFGSKLALLHRDASDEMNIMNEMYPSSERKLKTKLKPSLPPVLKTIKNLESLTPE